MQQARKQLKLLKSAARDRDPEAARALLAHSISLGHHRLAVQRYLRARAMGCNGLEAYRRLCGVAARRMGLADLLATAERAIGGYVPAELVRQYATELVSAARPTTPEARMKPARYATVAVMRTGKAS